MAKNDINIIKEIEKEIISAPDEIKKEILFNVPNTITILRLVFVFVFVYMLFLDFPRLQILGVFIFAAVTDWFDGFFARRLKQTTKFGAKLDQVTDRIFTGIIVIAIIIYLTSRAETGINIFTSGGNNAFLLIFLSVSREIVGAPGVFIAAIRKKGTYHVKYIGKVTTFIQGIAFGAIILGVPWAIFIVLPTCFIGIFSGINYLKYSLS
ncbi:CDP-alcohol phosphatidyltransferase family protein [Candidatus Pacearchaeota archaeon]|nr:CDP-alcohol phosphatidyltransferase family protein [Candidatus Pacearchaeota archaeon]